MCLNMFLKRNISLVLRSSFNFILPQSTLSLTRLNQALVELPGSGSFCHFAVSGSNVTSLTGFWTRRTETQISSLIQSPPPSHRLENPKLSSSAYYGPRVLHIVSLTLTITYNVHRHPIVQVRK